MNFQKYKRKVTKAFRQATESMVKEWKKQNPLIHGSLCPISGEKMGGNSPAEVDHADIPFQEILEDFMSQEGLLWEHVVVYYDPVDERYRLADPDLRDRWDLYHRQHATLRWASKHGNRKLGDGGYRKRKRQLTPYNVDREHRKYLAKLKTQRDLYEDGLRQTEKQILKNIFG